MTVWLCLTSIHGLMRDSGADAAERIAHAPSPEPDGDGKTFGRLPKAVPQRPLYSVDPTRPPSITAYTAYDDGHESTYRPDDGREDVRLAPILERDGTTDGSRYGTSEDNHAAPAHGHYASSDVYRDGYEGAGALSPLPNSLSPYALSPLSGGWPESMLSPRPAPRPPVGQAL